LIQNAQPFLSSALKMADGSVAGTWWRAVVFLLCKIGNPFAGRPSVRTYAPLLFFVRILTPIDLYRWLPASRLEDVPVYWRRNIDRVARSKGARFFASSAPLAAQLLQRLAIAEIDKSVALFQHTVCNFPLGILQVGGATLQGSFAVAFTGPWNYAAKCEIELDAGGV
jgi:hypothetical protein